METVDIHLILFCFWFNSIQLLLRYKSYLNICKNIGYDEKLVNIVAK